MSSTRSQSQLSTATPNFISFQCSLFISVFGFVSRHIRFKRNLTQVITLVAEWIDSYGVYHWRIFRSGYRKLAWVGFEPTTTEFRSDALTDWVIRPCVQLALRANCVQLLQFLLFAPCSFFISVFAFVRQRPKAKTEMKSEHEQRDEIGVTVQSWLWERVELMAW